MYSEKKTGFLNKINVSTNKNENFPGAFTTYISVFCDHYSIFSPLSLSTFFFISWSESVVIIFFQFYRKYYFFHFN